MKNSRENLTTSFLKLVEIMEKLRGPEGCPWDKKQTTSSLKPYLLEETYEVLEAIDENSPISLKEELGDLLFQIIFHSQIAKEKNDFNLAEVCEEISKKLIRRHPHVFSGEKVASLEEISRNWEKIKAEEKQNSQKSILSEIPPSLPSLLRAYKIGKKVSYVGFDWKDATGVLEKFQEEWKELQEAIEKENPQEIEDEFGDVLFTLSNLSRFLKINPEEALRRACKKFERRFIYLEEKIRLQNKELQSCSLEEMEKFWSEAKANLPGADEKFKNNSQ